MAKNTKEATVGEENKAERKKKSTETTKIFQTRLEDLIADKKEKEGITQNQIAENIGITHSALSGYASDIKEAGINSLCKIAKYFNVSTDWLLGLSDSPRTDPSLRAITDIYGLTNESINELDNLKKNDSLESKAALTFINTMIESFRLGTTSDSTISVWQLSRTLLAYTIHNQLRNLRHTDKKKNAQYFSYSDTKPNFEILEDEKYKLIMFFEQFIDCFQDNPTLKKKIKKIYDDKNFSYDDYNAVQLLIKSLGDAIIILGGGKNHTTISHPLAIFFDGIIKYERTSGSSAQNKAGILTVHQIPKRFDIPSEDAISTFLDSLPQSDLPWDEIAGEFFGDETDLDSEQETDDLLKKEEE